MTDLCNTMLIMTSGDTQNRVSSTSNTPSPLDEVNMDIAANANYYFSRPIPLSAGAFSVQSPYYPPSGYMIHYGDAAPANFSYSGSSSSDEQPFIANQEVMTATSSPTSIVSTQSLRNFPAPQYFDSNPENSYFRLPNTSISHIGAHESYGKRAPGEGYSQQQNNSSTYMSVNPNPNYGETDGNSNSLVGHSSMNSSPTAQEPPIKQETAPPVKRATYKKKSSHQKKKKRCFNCQSTNAPSWRRSISESSKGSLLCNACGLYEKTQRTNRKLVTGPDGITKVVRKRESSACRCAVCGSRDATKWHKIDDSLICLGCFRNQRKASL